MIKAITDGKGDVVKQKMNGYSLNSKQKKDLNDAFKTIV